VIRWRRLHRLDAIVRDRTSRRAETAIRIKNWVDCFVVHAVILGKPLWLSREMSTPTLGQIRIVVPLEYEGLSLLAPIVSNLLDGCLSTPSASNGPRPSALPFPRQAATCRHPCEAHQLRLLSCRRGRKRTLRWRVGKDKRR
jgi:hypothetical protein